MPPRARVTSSASNVLTLATLVLLSACASQPPSFDATRFEAEPTEATEPPRQVGPPSGSLVIAGGGALGAEIWERFLELAGGRDARIVVIPTASADEEFDEDWDGLDQLRAAGARNISLLHTRNPSEANSEDFVKPLLEADGVWMPGGRQWRLVDAYLHTRAHTALFDVLERGGVVGGTSAGASIQASFLVRGDPETNQTVSAPEYEEGFGLLLDTAVDQHLLTRSREDDLWEILALHPELLGIGIDEGTALVIQGNQAEVVGSSQVLIYDPADPLRAARSLRPGDAFDLGRRLPIRSFGEEVDEEEIDGGPDVEDRAATTGSYRRGTFR
ncbi:MAG: cyanophycinase [Gemmatimonadota bacterium]